MKSSEQNCRFTCNIQTWGHTAVSCNQNHITGIRYATDADTTLPNDGDCKPAIHQITQSYSAAQVFRGQVCSVNSVNSRAPEFFKGVIHHCNTVWELYGRKKNTVHPRIYSSARIFLGKNADRREPFREKTWRCWWYGSILNTWRRFCLCSFNSKRKSVWQGSSPASRRLSDSAWWEWKDRKTEYRVIFVSGILKTWGVGSLAEMTPTGLTHWENNWSVKTSLTRERKPQSLNRKENCVRRIFGSALISDLECFSLRLLTLCLGVENLIP